MTPLFAIDTRHQRMGPNPDTIDGQWFVRGIGQLLLARALSKSCYKCSKITNNCQRAIHALDMSIRYAILPIGISYRNASAAAGLKNSSLKRAIFVYF